LTGTTDFAEIAVENPPSEAHKLAFDILVDRILGYIGNYYVKLGGEIDALVFAGGIGEKSALLRRTLSEKCKSLGIAIDSQANDKGPGDDETVKDISKGAGKGPRVLICQTNEQVSQSVTSAADTRSLILVPQFEMAYHCIRQRS
jgi:acetate kinase